MPVRRFSRTLRGSFVYRSYTFSDCPYFLQCRSSHIVEHFSFFVKAVLNSGLFLAATGCQRPFPDGVPAYYSPGANSPSITIPRRWAAIASASTNCAFLQASPLEREEAKQRQGTRTDRELPVNFTGSSGNSMDKVASAACGNLPQAAGKKGLPFAKES